MIPVCVHVHHIVFLPHKVLSYHASASEDDTTKLMVVLYS